MNSRYRIEARRNENEEWSTWTETDDLYNIQKHYARVIELGYEARVVDPKITEWERLQKNGILLFTPVRVGQTVYAVVPGGEKYVIHEWQVKSIRFDGKKWYAVDDLGQEYAVRSQWCFLFKGNANKLLKELNGENDE